MTISPLSQVAAAEFAPEVTYLNTSSWGLLPRRTIAAVKALADENAAGRRIGAGSFDAVEAARAASPGSPGCGRTGSPPAARSPSMSG